MTGMTDIAVIMSVYQNDKLEFVRESVQSILNQTYPQFHFYIIFDGPVSSDIESYISSLPDERIRTSRLEKNSGLAVALNFLLEKVLKKSDYIFIARMDADDISMPERFEKQRKFLIDNHSVSVVGSWYEEIDEDGKNISYRELPVTHEEIRLFFMKRSPFAHPSVMFNRNFFAKAGYYSSDNYRMEDYVLWGNAINSGLILANIQEYLLKFRIDKNFYKRRSGIKFGYNFIVTKFQINSLLKEPIKAYIFSAITGLVRMMPAYCLKYLYKSMRK